MKELPKSKVSCKLNTTSKRRRCTKGTPNDSENCKVSDKGNCVINKNKKVKPKPKPESKPKPKPESKPKPKPESKPKPDSKLKPKPVKTPSKFPISPKPIKKSDSDISIEEDYPVQNPKKVKSSESSNKSDEQEDITQLTNTIVSINIKDIGAELTRVKLAKNGKQHKFKLGFGYPENTTPSKQYHNLYKDDDELSIEGRCIIKESNKMDIQWVV